MNGLTYTDILRMEDVLADARQILAEDEQVVRGEKVKITFYPADGKGPFSHCYPFRVAEYARKMLGAHSPICETTTVSFTFCGCATTYQPTIAGYRAFTQALLARSCAEYRQTKRALAKLGYKSLRGQKGGAAL